MIFATVMTAGLLVFQRYVLKRTNSVAIAADKAHYVGDLGFNLAIILALVLTYYTALPSVDAWFGMGLGLYLLYTAYNVSQDAFDLLMDRELSDEDRKKIKETVLAHPEVRNLHDLRTRFSGHEYFIEFHLEIDGHLTVSQAHEVTDAIEAELGKLYPKCWISIHQEPAGLDDARLDHVIAAQKR
jgi:ferrous-iron efflux pump FieF